MAAPTSSSDTEMSDAAHAAPHSSSSTFSARARATIASTLSAEDSLATQMSAMSVSSSRHQLIFPQLPPLTSNKDLLSWERRLVQAAMFIFARQPLPMCIIEDNPMDRSFSSEFTLSQDELLTAVKALVTAQQRNPLLITAPLIHDVINDGPSLDTLMALLLAVELPPSKMDSTVQDATVLLQAAKILPSDRLSEQEVLSARQWRVAMTLSSESSPHVQVAHVAAAVYHHLRSSCMDSLHVMISGSPALYRFPPDVKFRDILSLTFSKSHEHLSPEQMYTLEAFCTAVRMLVTLDTTCRVSDDAAWAALDVEVFPSQAVSQLGALALRMVAQSESIVAASRIMYDPNVQMILSQSALSHSDIEFDPDELCAHKIEFDVTWVCKHPTGKPFDEIVPGNVTISLSSTHGSTRDSSLPPLDPITFKPCADGAEFLEREIRRLLRAERRACRVTVKFLNPATSSKFTVIMHARSLVRLMDKNSVLIQLVIQSPESSAFMADVKPTLKFIQALGASATNSDFVTATGHHVSSRARLDYTGDVTQLVMSMFEQWSYVLEELRSTHVTSNGAAASTQSRVNHTSITILLLKSHWFARWLPGGDRAFLGALRLEDLCRIAMHRTTLVMLRTAAVYFLVACRDYVSALRSCTSKRTPDKHPSGLFHFLEGLQIFAVQLTSGLSMDRDVAFEHGQDDPCRTLWWMEPFAIPHPAIIDAYDPLDPVQAVRDALMHFKSTVTPPALQGEQTLDDFVNLNQSRTHLSMAPQSCFRSLTNDGKVIDVDIEPPVALVAVGLNSSDMRDVAIRIIAHYAVTKGRSIRFKEFQEMLLSMEAVRQGDLLAFSLPSRITQVHLDKLDTEASDCDEPIALNLMYFVFLTVQSVDTSADDNHIVHFNVRTGDDELVLHLRWKRDLLPRFQKRRYLHLVPLIRAWIHTDVRDPVLEAFSVYLQSSVIPSTVYHAGPVSPEFFKSYPLCTPTSGDDTIDVLGPDNFDPVPTLLADCLPRQGNASLWHQIEVSQLVLTRALMKNQKRYYFTLGRANAICLHTGMFDTRFTHDDSSFRVHVSQVASMKPILHSVMIPTNRWVLVMDRNDSDDKSWLPVFSPGFLLSIDDVSLTAKVVMVMMDRDVVTANDIDHVDFECIVREVPLRAWPSNRDRFFPTYTGFIPTICLPQYVERANARQAEMDLEHLATRIASVTTMNANDTRNASYACKASTASTASTASAAPTAFAATVSSNEAPRCVTGFTYHDDMLLHCSGTGGKHVESPERVSKTVSHLHTRGVWSKLKHIPIQPLTSQDLISTKLYEQHYVDRLVRDSDKLGLSPQNGVNEFLKPLYLDHDMDTYFMQHTLRASLLAASSVATLMKCVFLDNPSGGAVPIDAAGLSTSDAASSASAGSICVSNGFALSRPPGHHSHANSSSGFCIFNNVAVGVQMLRNTCKVLQQREPKIAIVDFDVHAADGTSSIFWDDPNVLLIDLHRYGRKFYPGTGSAKHVGGSKALGMTVNIPFTSTGMGDKEYLFAFQAIVLPILRSFGPDIIVVSAGFDCASGDPLGKMMVTPIGFYHMTKMLLGVQSRVVMALEGGYDCKNVAEGVEACLCALRGEPCPATPSFHLDTMISPLWSLAHRADNVHPTCRSNVKSVYNAQKSYWSSALEDLDQVFLPTNAGIVDTTITSDSVALAMQVDLVRTLAPLYHPSSSSSASDVALPRLALYHQARSFVNQIASH